MNVDVTTSNHWYQNKRDPVKQKAYSVNKYYTKDECWVKIYSSSLSLYNIIGIFDNNLDVIACL